MGSKYPEKMLTSVLQNSKRESDGLTGHLKNYGQIKLSLLLGNIERENRDRKKYLQSNPRGLVTPVKYHYKISIYMKRLSHPTIKKLKFNRGDFSLVNILKALDGPFFHDCTLIF